MLQINKMAQAIVKLIEDVERLQTEVEFLKNHPVIISTDNIDIDSLHPGRIVPILYREGDKVDERLKNGG